MTLAVSFREATPSDVPEMVRCRAGDPTIGPADPRMAPYLEGKHHPQHALAPRVIFICMDGDSAIGYIGGHLALSAYWMVWTDITAVPGD